MIQLQDLIHNSRPLFAGDLLGTVVDNLDPKQLGRIRVQIPGMMTNSGFQNVAAGTKVGKYKKVALTPAASGQTGLPWLTAANTPGTPGLDVPEIGTTVGVRFKNNNPAEGSYVSTPLSAQSIPAELLVDYPNSYGWKNSKGDWFRVNKHSGQWDISHHSGFRLTIDDTGDVTVTYPANLTETIQGNVTRTIQGTLTETVHGSVTETLGSRTTNVTGDDVTTATGSIRNTAPSISNQGPQ